MAVMHALSAGRTTARGGLRVLAVAKPTKTAVVAKAKDAAQMQMYKMAALTTVAGNMLLAGHAQAAQAVAEVAAGDNRGAVLLTLFVPVVGWVGFNIFGPALNQLDSMSDRNRAVVAGAGVGLASLLMAGNADAAQQVMTLAESDNRLGVLLALFLPVIGWVGFNIFGPALNQLDSMSDRNRSVVAGAGLGLASLLAAGNADAAQQVMTLAESDNRLGVLLALFLPVIGWVAFNIFGPLLNQLDDMSSKK